MVNHVINAAECRGDIKKGDRIVEASSGNTGVALSMIAAVKGYKATIVVPNTTSNIKVRMMKAYGAQILYTNAEKGVIATVQKAKRISEDHDAFLLNQFNNPDNIKSQHTIGIEILSQVEQVDVFIAGIGTGGTLIGVAEVLKKENHETQIIAVEPYTAPVFYNMFYGERLPIGNGIPHGIEGIGESFVSEILKKNMGIIDDVILVNDQDAFQTCSRLALKEGLFVGISSGANVWASLKQAMNVNKGMIIMTILPDNGQRYLT